MSLVDSWTMKEKTSPLGGEPHKVGVDKDDIIALSAEQGLVDGYFFVNKGNDFAVVVKQSANAKAKALTWSELQDHVGHINQRDLSEHRNNGSTGTAKTYMKAQIALLELPLNVKPEDLPAAERFVLPETKFALDAAPAR